MTQTRNEDITNAMAKLTIADQRRQWANQVLGLGSSRQQGQAAAHESGSPRTVQQEVDAYLGANHERETNTLAFWEVHHLDLSFALPPCNSDETRCHW